MHAASQSPKPTYGRILIVDDEPAMGHILVKSLGADGYVATAFSDPARALASIEAEQPDVILTDVRMPGMTGVELLRRLRERHPEIPVLIMSAFGTIEDAVAMLKDGAFNYITKPFQHAHLLRQIELAISHRKLEHEVTRLAEHAGGGVLQARALVGQSEPMGRMRELIGRAAQTDSVVLITGESGTGKELVAREIHRLSPRSTHRFVAVNCPAIPTPLIESELFGFERGAFTGADRAKMGLIELSHGGTLFLDEVGELPLDVQVKLLRVLQEHEVQRLGGLRTIPVDLRIVAATNRDLEKEVREKQFRADLYYRLKVLMIHAPPLRERAEDIPALVEHFCAATSRRIGREMPRLSREALTKLSACRWPGNIRELENAVERTLALAPGNEIGTADLPPDLIRELEIEDKLRRGERLVPDAMQIEWPDSYREAKDLFERSYLEKLLKLSGGKIAAASKISGISRRHLYEKLEQHGLGKGSEIEGGE